MIRDFPSALLAGVAGGAVAAAVAIGGDLLLTPLANGVARLIGIVFLTAAPLTVVSLLLALKDKGVGWVGLNAAGLLWFLLGILLLVGLPQQMHPGFQKVPFILAEVIGLSLLLVSDLALLERARRS